MPTQANLAILEDPRPSQSSTTKLPLRDYQEAALASVSEAESRGVRKQLISLPTGSGKTVLAAHLIARKGWRTVFIVHRDELVKQSVAKIHEVDPANYPGVVKADQNSVYSRTIIASAQTLAHQNRLDQLVKATRGEKLLVISDECHHDRAVSRTRAIEQLAPDLLVGLTATPTRGDKLGLDAVYDEIVHHIPMLDLIARNILSPLKGVRVESTTDLDDVHTRAGEFAENELGEAVDSEERNQLIVAAWQKHAVGRKRTVAFCVNVAHAIAVRDAFRAAGVACETILGETPAIERARILGDFADGKIPVLTNCMVLTEGYDEPRIDCEIMCRPTKSTGLYIQMVGRAARRAEGKRDALIIDIVDVTRRHKLITLPTLAGIDETEGVTIREASEEDRNADEEMDLLEYARERAGRQKTRSHEVNLFAGSDHLWRMISGLHMAPDGRGKWLMLIPRGVGYIPARLFQGDRRAGKKPRVEELFDRALEAETAIALAEGTTATDKLTSKTADWRKGIEPASEAQLKYARGLGVRVPPQATKGQVSDLIDEAVFSLEIKWVGGI